MRLSPSNLGGIFDVDKNQKRLEEIEIAMQDPSVWNDPKQMQSINQEKSLLEKSVLDWEKLNSKVEDAIVLLEMAKDANDEDSFLEVKSEIKKISELHESLELKSFLSGEADSLGSYISINSGAGGTEACDWAGMLLRMYTRYAEKNGFKVEVISMTAADEAGIKSATLSISGPFAYGYLKAESGVHRLVRISPFDSNARRHTSFASVFAWPEVDDSIEIEVKEEDIRVDTYRASGAGGQHVNTTDSAVRITHEPTGVVVQCQNQRSQHANKDKALKMLKAALYEKEIERRNQEKDQLNSEKKANEWGSQIRSYVLHPYQMVKDHRTNHEISRPDNVLDGDLSSLIETYLKYSKTDGAN